MTTHGDRPLCRMAGSQHDRPASGKATIHRTLAAPGNGSHASRGMNALVNAPAAPDQPIAAGSGPARPGGRRAREWHTLMSPGPIPAEAAPQNDNSARFRMSGLTTAENAY